MSKSRPLTKNLDPLQVFHLVVHLGHIERVSVRLGLKPRSLHGAARRPQNYRIRMAIDFGMYVYRHNRVRVLTGQGHNVVGPARTSSARARSTR